MLDVGNLLLPEGEHGAKGVSVVIESFAGGHGQLFEKDENSHGCLHGNLHLHKYDLSVWAVLVWRVAADDALLGVSLEVLVVDDKESEVCKGLVLPCPVGFNVFEDCVSIRTFGTDFDTRYSVRVLGNSSVYCRHCLAVSTIHI